MNKTGKKLTSATITTDIGPVHIVADQQGLIGIMLPAPGRKQQKTTVQATTGNVILKTAAQQIREYLQGNRRYFDIPLHINGTDFQKQVWDIIRHIPYGQTLSYGEIARKLGNSGKARAVGGAAHANPLPLIIPCHRVIGSDGSLTGFGGGLDLKTKLLELEKKSR